MRILAGEFIGHVMKGLIFPLEDQEHIGEGKNLWCLDWWVIEIGKYFFEGEVDYVRFPLARRCENNDNFKKKDIVTICKHKEANLEQLKLSTSTKVLVFETCRGFDTKLVSNIKEWDTIYVTHENRSKAAIEKTELYLRRFNNVELIDRKTFEHNTVLPWMKSTPFKGGFNV